MQSMDNILENRNFIRLVTKHSCSTTGNAVRVAVQQALTTVRQRAATMMENPAQIRNTVVQGVSTAVLGCVYSFTFLFFVKI